MGRGRDLIPPAVGIGLTAMTTMGIRAFLTPTPGSPAEAMYRSAPLFGVGAGVLGGLAVGVLGGKSQAASTIMTAVVTGAVLYGMERLNASKPGAMAALIGTPTAVVPGAPLGAIVPQYPTRGLGAIVMERLRGNEQGQGADITLKGVVNTNAFGSRVAG